MLRGIARPLFLELLSAKLLSLSLGLLPGKFQPGKYAH